MSCNCSTSLPVGPVGPKGDTGATGATGANGSTGPAGVVVLYNNMTPVATTNTSYASLKSYSLPLNTLNAAGDVVEVTAVLDTNGTTIKKFVRLQIGGAIVMTNIPYFSFDTTEKLMTIKFTISMVSTSSVYIEYSAYIVDSNYNSKRFNVSYESFAMDTTIARTILIEGFTANTSENLNIKQMMVKSYTIN